MTAGQAGLGALLLADGRLPVGGLVYSAGLEPGLADGMTPADVPRYLRARLRTAGLVDAATAVLAHRAAMPDARPDAGFGLDDVQEALAARTPSAPLRDAQAVLGRGLARLAERLRPDHPATVALRGLGRAPLRPVALGCAAAALGVDEEATARASLYDDAQAVASAALKLSPGDPADAAGWVLAAEPDVAALVRSAVAVRHPDDLPATTAPQAEGWSLTHQHRTRRIFVA
ncbi:urease accessory UreF family protein [Isoptericola sp. F-RaC21]|uniref:urease accessory protein UreF n=1 Tax=Isoptericola sp. F-RaC21 TaxID=3141452 RepID=UPI00315BD252